MTWRGQLTVLLGSATVYATETKVNPEAQAQTDLEIQIAVANASKAWKDAFNAGDAAAATALLKEDHFEVAQ